MMPRSDNSLIKDIITTAPIYLKIVQNSHQTVLQYHIIVQKWTKVQKYDLKTLFVKCPARFFSKLKSTNQKAFLATFSSDEGVMQVPDYNFDTFL